MRAATGLDADDALGRERLVGDEELGVLFCIDVVGHHRDVEAVAQPLAQRKRERRLAGTDRSSDAYAQGHERNSLLYCVSCLADSSASLGAKFPISSSFI